MINWIYAALENCFHLMEGLALCKQRPNGFKRFSLRQSLFQRQGKQKGVKYSWREKKMVSVPFLLDFASPSKLTELFVHDKPLMLNFGLFPSLSSPPDDDFCASPWSDKSSDGIYLWPCFRLENKHATSFGRDCLLPQFTSKLPRLRWYFWLIID